MSKYEVGTIVKDVSGGDHYFEYDPVEGKEPWVTRDADPFLVIMYGDSDGEIRFSEAAMEEDFAEGLMEIVGGSE